MIPLSIPSYASSYCCSYMEIFCSVSVSDCSANYGQICLILACINSRVSTETTYTSATLLHTSRQPTTRSQRHTLSVGQYTRVCNTGVIPVKPVCSTPPTKKCRLHHGLILEWCFPSSMSDPNHQPTKAHQIHSATDAIGSLLLSSWHMLSVSFLRRQQTKSYVGAMNIILWQQIPAEFLWCLQPHSPNFYVGDTRVDKSSRQVTHMQFSYIYEISSTEPPNHRIYLELLLHSPSLGREKPLPQLTLSSSLQPPSRNTS